MNKIFDLELSDLNIKDVLDDCLKKQRLEDLMLIKSKYIGGELEDKIDQVEIDYEFNLEKMDYVSELNGRDYSVQRKFTEMALYIDEMDIAKGNKMEAMITLSTVLSKVPTHVELLDNDNLFTLCTSMVCLPLSEYESHGQIVSNPVLLDSIKSKTDDLNERREMIYDIFDYCDLVAYEDMPQSQYIKAINDCVKMVNTYELKTINKEK